MSADFNFNFRGAADPLLGASSDYATQFEELERAQRVLEQRKQTVMQLKNQSEMELQGKPSSQTPIWDEIDALTAAMSESEFSALQQDQGYIDSLGALMSYVSAVQLQMIRPSIEQSAEGKRLLEQHLTTVKYLHKSLSAEKERTLADFKDYTENYSHMSWDEYLKSKGGTKK